MLAAVVLGASSPWVAAAITVLSAYITLPLAQHLIQASRGSGISHETWRFAIRAGGDVIEFIAYGILFGVPLGFFAVERVRLYWFVFAVGAFVGSLLGTLASPLGINGFFLYWSYPETWLYLFAVACFAYIGVYIRNRVERRGNAARYRLAFAITSMLLVASIGGVGWYLIESSG
jgi:hypothetical protein